MTSWRSQAVVDRAGLAFLVVGGATSFPALAVAAALSSDLRDRATWSSTGTPDTYPGGPVDVISLALTAFTVGVAVTGAVLLARHLERHGTPARTARVTAVVLLALVLLADVALVAAALRSAP